MKKTTIMKKTTLTILTTLIVATMTFAQFDHSKLSRYSQQIENLEENIDKKDNEYDLYKSDFEDEIDNLDYEDDPLSALTQRVELLEEKQQKFEDVTEQKESFNIDISQIRYEVGLLVIKDMIEYLGTLQSQFASLDFQRSYTDLSSPNTFPTFQQNINHLTEKSIRKGFTLPDMDMGNAFLNTAYFLTRSIVSERRDKHNLTQETLCILDFTSQASCNLPIINFDLQYLTSELGKMNHDFNMLFGEYTSKVGYSNTFDNYISGHSDNLDSDLIPNYFTMLKNESETQRNRQLRDINFALSKVMDAYNEYERFVGQGLAYYKKFSSITNTLNPQCDNSAISTELQTRFDNMQHKLERAQLDFEKAYRGKIKQTYLKQLIEM